MGRMMNTPEGTRDLLYEECRLRRQVQARLTEVFRCGGYSELSTPVIEYYDAFCVSGSNASREGMLKMIGRGGRILVLRPDCTLPIARIAATRLKNEPLPLRLYYNEAIFRATKANAGHMGEVDQCGVELIGASGVRADAEVAALSLQALKNCGVEHFRLELGHAGFFKALADELDADEDTVEEIRSLIEQKSIAALDALLKKVGTCSGSHEALRRLSMLFGGEEVPAQARALTDNPAALEALEELSAVYDTLCRAGWGEYVGFDLGLVHQMEYYTGLVFCGYVEGTGHVVVSGGRYDHLMGAFGRSAPATGFAIDVDGVAGALPHEGRTVPQKLVHYEPHQLSEAVAYQRSRPAGTVELSCCATVEGSRALARKKGISTLVLMGTQEEETI